MMTNKKQNTLRLTVAGMMIAIEIIMAFTPIGFLEVGILSITFMPIPVIVGAITNDLWMGAVMGLTFGLASFARCFGIEPFGTGLMGINPVGTFITCVCTRTLVGILCALIYKGLSRIKAPVGVQVGISAFSAPFLNTVFFMSSLILFFWKTDLVQNWASSKGTDSILAFVIAAVGINGILEWTICTAVGSAISIALLKALKRLN